MEKRRVLAALLLAAVMLIMTTTGTLGQFASASDAFPVFSNFGGQGGTDSGEAVPRAVWSDPLPPPDFELGFFEGIDLNAPEPMHLPGIGPKAAFTYADDKVLFRGFTDTWVRDAYYIRLTWRSPDGEIFDNMPQLYIQHPHAMVALWDYWEWTAWWQYLDTDEMAPGLWSVDVSFRWGYQSILREKVIATETFTLTGVRPSKQALPPAVETDWVPPVVGLMKVCREVDLYAMQFDMMPPIDPYGYGDVIEGDSTSWAYVRLISDFGSGRLLDEAMHLAFFFRYEDPRVKFSIPHMDPYIYDVQHARTSFKTWTYWDNYFVAAVDFNPSSLGMFAGTWYIDVYAYPDSGDISMRKHLGTMCFALEGDVPAPPSTDVDEDDIDVTATPNPFQDEVKFEASASGIMVSSLEVSIYDLTGHMVFSGSGVDSVIWDGRGKDGLWLGNGAYIYVATAMAEGTRRTEQGIVCIKR